MADKITTPAGRTVEIDRKALRKMKHLAALRSSDFDRLMEAMAAIIPSLTVDQIGELDEDEFKDLGDAVRREYNLPKAS